MRTWFVLTLVAACGSSSTPARGPVDPPPAVAAPGAGEPVQPQAKVPAGAPRYDARTFFETVKMRGASFSHDGMRVLMSSNATGVYNVYAQPVAGGAPVALTKSTKESFFALQYFPADDRFLYTADVGGNELSHVFVVDQDGTTKDLTPGDNVKASFLGFTKDGKNFFITTNERDQKVFDLYRYNTEGYGRGRMFTNGDAYGVDAISPDGNWAALTKTITNANSDVYIVDITPNKRKPGKPELVTKHKGDVEHGVFSFTTDSKKLIYATNGHGEFEQAWSYDLKTRKLDREHEAKWDVADVFYSKHGKYRVVVTNEDARSVLSIVELKTGKPVVAKNLPPGDITRAVFDGAEKQMAFYLDSDRAPADLYVLDLATGEAKRLSNNLNPKVDRAHLVDSQVVRYKSFDGLEIPAILYRPVDAGPDARVPAMVWVHGGPGGQSRVGYSALIQYIVNHGYAVLMVNNRGSNGYGKTFFHLDDRKHGDVDLEDCVFGRTYLATLDWVDGSRVGIMGGSYGGYMTLAALAFKPDAFDVGVDIFGVSNWVRTLESMPPHWASFRDRLIAELGDPATDKERLTARSPLFHAKNIKKPLLVIQGANDPRVIKVESDEIVAAAKKAGAPVEYLVFEDEGHGFNKRKNEISSAEKIVAFLDRYLVGR